LFWLASLVSRLWRLQVVYWKVRESTVKYWIVLESKKSRKVWEQ